MVKLEAVDFIAMRGWHLTDKEKILFKRSVGTDVIENGILLYVLTKRNGLKRALDIGTGDWFSALCLAIAGAWVVSLDYQMTLPARWGIMNAYKDKVFAIQQSPNNYLSGRNNMWDIIFVNGNKEKTDIKKDLESVKGKYNRYLIVSNYDMDEAVTEATNEIIGIPDYFIVDNSIAIFERPNI